MTVAAMCYMSFCTVTWLNMDSPIRALVTGASVVEQSLKNLAIQLIIKKEEMKLKYRADFQTLLELSIDRQINPSIENIEAAVRKNTEEGKSGRHCYERAVLKSLSISNHLFLQMMPCLNTFRREFDENVYKITEAIKQIKDAQRAIKNMIPDCQLKDDVLQCVKQNVMQTSVFLKNQKNVVEELNRTMRENYDNSLTDALSCSSRTGNELSAAAASIENAATECMKA